MHRLHIATTFGFAAMLSMSAARAGPCTSPSPFTDVQASDVFCAEVAWLRNRNVTLGCTLTEFCPLQAVSRGQIALFLNRLAIATAPAVEQTDTSLVLPTDLDSEPVLCESSAIAPTNRRIGRALAGLAFHAPTDADIGVRLVRRVNGGPYVQDSAFFPVVTAKGGVYTSTIVMSEVSIWQPGEIHQYAVRLHRVESGTTGDLSFWSCQLRVEHHTDPSPN